MKHICLWSGPRNVSTALMYSFAQRSDTHVIDEPLYGHYLRVSGSDHPGRDEVLAAMPGHGDAVMHKLLSEPHPRPLVFMKHMAHHLVDMSDDFLARTQNILLIRAPADMLPSLTVQIPHATLADTGLAQQAALLERLAAAGNMPAVIDSKQLLLDPPGVLERLCSALEIDWQPAMLQWQPGARPEDGVWAKHWYHAVHRSTGFAPYRAKANFPQRLQPLLAECQPHYEQLVAHAILATTSGGHAIDER